MATPGCQFASDNCSGVCPEAWTALQQALEGCAPAYGNDRWTARASDLLRELFETDCETFFCFNGTAANSLAIAHLCRSYHSVICQQNAHIETDECGGPEFFSNGTKILLVDGKDGKIDPQGVENAVLRRTDIHYPKPRVLSLTQATELGTVYTVAELAELGETARRHDLRIHMDGARFANAVASLGVAPKDITWKVGIDVLCFGGAKNGIPIGEAVIFFDKERAREFDYRCKQAGQLASKMRTITGPWVGMLETGAWLSHARRANAQARLLAERIAGIPNLKLLSSPQANSVFLDLPAVATAELRRRGWYFYNFIGASAARFMCSWATTEEDIAALTRDLAASV